MSPAPKISCSNCASLFINFDSFMRHKTDGGCKNRKTVAIAPRLIRIPSDVSLRTGDRLKITTVGVVQSFEELGDGFQNVYLIDPERTFKIL